MESSGVTNVLENMTDNCREIKKVARFKGTLVFTDVGSRQVKWYNPSTKKVETLAGDGSEGAQDDTKKSCSFVQVHGTCNVSDTLFTTDAAARKIKFMTGLSGTTDFLKHLGVVTAPPFYCPFVFFFLSIFSVFSIIQCIFVIHYFHQLLFGYVTFHILVYIFSSVVSIVWYSFFSR